MHHTNKFAYANFIQLIFDIIALVFTFDLAFIISDQFNQMHGIAYYFWIWFFYALVWVFIMESQGMYNKTTFYYHDRVLRSIILSSVIAAMGCATVLFLINAFQAIRVFYIILFILSIICMFGERILTGYFFRRSMHLMNTPRVIVVCTTETYKAFRRFLYKTQIAYNIVGVIQADPDKTVENALNLGRIEDLPDLLKNSVVDEVIFSLPRHDNSIDKFIPLCEQMGITVRIILNSYDMQSAHAYISMLGPLPMVTFHSVSLNLLQRTLKRIIDIIGSLVGLAITLVLAVFIIPAIRLDSSGPALFVQKRVGLNGRIFNMYKFRTMYNNAEVLKDELAAMNEYEDGLMFKIENDPRITRVGHLLRKTSLDEMPQFFNVLKGDMSLVGTRPPTVDEYALYKRKHRRRLSIRPGITGMWQVNGRSSITDFETVVALDTQYIDKWSIWLDLSIIFQTIAKVVEMESSY